MNLKVQYHVHKSHHWSLSWARWIQLTTATYCFSKTHYNFIFPLTSRFSFRISDQNFVRFSHLSHSCYMPRQSYISLLDDSNNIWWSVQVMMLPIMQSSWASCHFLPLRYKRVSSVSCFQIPSMYVPYLVWQNRFHTITKQEVKL
jgi:hypothetical protein